MEGLFPDSHPGLVVAVHGLAEAWQLKHFGTLGQDALSRPNVHGLPLMIENAFDLSPSNNNLNSPHPPHFANGTDMNDAGTIFTIQPFPAVRLGTASRLLF